jgi:hypothetical protein
MSTTIILTGAGTVSSLEDGWKKLGRSNHRAENEAVAQPMNAAVSI